MSFIKKRNSPQSCTGWWFSVSPRLFRKTSLRLKLNKRLEKEDSPVHSRDHVTAQFLISAEKYAWGEPGFSLRPPVCFLENVRADFQLSSLEDRSLFAATQCYLIESGVEEIFGKYFIFFPCSGNKLISSNAPYPEEDQTRACGGGLVTKSWQTHFDAMDCSGPGSSAHGVLQARILEWVAMSFTRGSFPPWHRTRVSCIVGGLFTDWASRESDVGIECWDLGAWEWWLESELGSLGFSFYPFPPMRCHVASRSAGRCITVESAAWGEHGGFGYSRLSPGRRGGQLGEGRVYLSTGSFAKHVLLFPGWGSVWVGGPPRLPGPTQWPLGRSGWLWSSVMGVSGLFWVWPEVTHTVYNPSPQYLHTGDLSLHWLR